MKVYLLLSSMVSVVICIAIFKNIEVFNEELSSLFTEIQFFKTEYPIYLIFLVFFGTLFINLFQLPCYFLYNILIVYSIENFYISCLYLFINNLLVSLLLLHLYRFILTNQIIKLMKKFGSVQFLSRLILKEGDFCILSLLRLLFIPQGVIEIVNSYATHKYYISLCVCIITHLVNSLMIVYCVKNFSILLNFNFESFSQKEEENLKIFLILFIAFFKLIFPPLGLYFMRKKYNSYTTEEGLSSMDQSEFEREESSSLLKN